MEKSRDVNKRTESSIIKIGDDLCFRVVKVHLGNWNAETIADVYHVLMGKKMGYFRKVLLDLRTNAFVFFKAGKKPVVVIDMDCIYDEDIHEVCAKLCINEFPLNSEKDIFRIKDMAFDFIKERIEQK